MITIIFLMAKLKQMQTLHKECDTTSTLQCSLNDKCKLYNRIINKLYNKLLHIETDLQLMIIIRIRIRYF